MINTEENGVQINLTNFVQFSAFIFNTVNEKALIMRSHILDEIDTFILLCQKHVSVISKHRNHTLQTIPQHSEEEEVCKKCIWTLSWKLKHQIDNSASTCDFQQCGILTGIYSDEPV